MNADQMQGKWKQIKGSVKERWGKLTDDDVDVVNGQMEQLVGRIQERYGIAKDEARTQVDDWLSSQHFDTERAETTSEKDLDRDIEKRRAS
jgi:uncharacterized protein YjbJ (UPF0337 family)